MAYSVPQVLVFQEFNLVPAAITDPLRAVVAGPHAQLLRYAEDDEKTSIGLGNYDPIFDHHYLWPMRAAGGVVDETYVKLFIDDARLEYFVDAIGTDLTVAPVADTPDRVAITGGGGFRDNGPLYPRLAGLYDRDVQVGDRVSLRGIVSAVQYELETYVKSIKATQTEPVLGTAVPDAGNTGTQGASAVVTKLDAATTCNTLAAILTDYDATRDGAINDTYTIEVVEPSLDGDLSTATLRVRSASGTDDDLVAASGDLEEEFTVGHRGLKLRWDCAASAGGSVSADDLTIGERWSVVVHDDYVVLAGTVAGTYTGTKDTTYVVNFTRGGSFAAPIAADRPQFTVSTTHGIDVSGPTTVAATGTAYPVGTKGVTFAVAAAGTPTAARKGDKFYIEVTAAADGLFNILELGHSLAPGAVTAVDMDLVLSISKDIQVPQRREGAEPIVNWETTDTEFTTISGITAFDPTFTDGGVPVPLPVKSGLMFVEYRAWLPGLVGTLGGISDVGDLDAISGSLSPDNPLKWGVFKALSNSNGTEVKFTAVADPAELDRWQDVVDLLVGRDDIYGLVPLTHDKQVLDLFVGHINSQSSAEAGRWRVMWTALRADTRKAVVDEEHATDGAVVLATIADDPTTSATQYTWLQVPARNANFATNGTKAGDIVRFNFATVWGEETYDEYIIDAVVNEDTLRLVSGPVAAQAVALKMEVWHTLAKNEIAADLAQQAGAYASRRVRAVWPDIISSGGTSMDGYFLCCALAGLRSGVVPHQGLTNVELAGFDDVSRTVDYFNTSQLNTMAEAGVWVVTQLPNGRVVTRHATTSDTLDVNRREEMVTANVDSMSFLFRRRLEPFIGRTNVTPTALAILRVEIDSSIEYLKANGFTPSLGSQLIDGTIIQLRPHALLKDRVVAVVSLDIPYPLNNIELHLVV